jgi:hypothetical protein
MPGSYTTHAGTVKTIFRILFGGFFARNRARPRRTSPTPLVAPLAMIKTKAAF